MATERPVFAETYSHGSDDFYDFQCSPCAKDGKNKPGVKHCIDCDENLCVSCLKDHNKFASMRSHKILDTPQNQSGQRQLPTQRCTKHTGKLIDKYCPHHDTVGCSACFTVEHSSCLGIKYIPDVAKGLSMSPNILRLESEISDLHSRLTTLKQRKDNDLKTLRKDRDKIHEEIKALRQKLNRHLDEMERNLMKEVDTKIKEKEKDLGDAGTTIDHFLSELQNEQKNLKEAKGNDCELFVLMKSTKESHQECADNADKLGRSVSYRNLKLKANRGFEKLVNGLNTMGRVTEDFVQMSARFKGKYNMRTHGDKMSCAAYTIFTTVQGDLIVADAKNKKLKRLDKAFNVISYVALPDCPYGACQIDNSQLATTLIDQKKVQLVSNTEPMKLLSSFSTGDRCRGILLNDGLLFVCCGGSKAREDEGPGRLEVYSTKGVLLRSYYHFMQTPCHLTASSNGRAIYIFDSYSGLIILENECTAVSKFRYHELEISGGICKLKNDFLCIAGNKSDNIAVVTDDGQFRQLLLTKNEGVVGPRGVYFDEESSSLMFTMANSDLLYVFQIDT